MTEALASKDLDESEVAEALTQIRNGLSLKDFTTEKIHSEGVAGVAIANALSLLMAEIEKRLYISIES